MEGFRSRSGLLLLLAPSALAIKCFEGWKMYQPQSGEYDCSSLTGVEDKATYEQEWREEDNYVFDCSTLPEQYTECLLMTYTNE